jgi:hypothetical protein
MNRTDRPAYRLPSFPAEPMDAPRRTEASFEASFIDHGQGERSWTAGGATDLAFESQNHGAGEADGRNAHAYHCFFMNTEKMITAVEVIECADDADAGQAALRLLRERSPYAVEVWNDARKVFHARGHGAAANASAVPTD